MGPELNEDVNDLSQDDEAFVVVHAALHPRDLHAFDFGHENVR